jgi:excisionase family DNA binding protein
MIAPATIANPPDDDIDAMLADGCVTVVDAAKFLALGKSTIYDAMDAGRLPFVHLGRARRIPKRALIDYAKANLKGGWAIRHDN